MTRTEIGIRCFAALVTGDESHLAGIPLESRDGRVTRNLMNLGLEMECLHCRQLERQ